MTTTAASAEAAQATRGLRPMLLRSGDLPIGAGWRYEPKWDGFRALVHIGDPWAPLRVVSRHGTDLTARFPELARLSDVLAGRRVVLDGELVVCGDDGRPDFDRLRARMFTRAGRLRSLAAAAPAAFVAFDVLWCDGDMTGEPYEARRQLLESLELDGGSWQVTPVSSDGPALWQVVIDHQLEGLVAKRVSSRYLPGRRSGDWVKVKRWQHVEAVIGGFTVGRTGTVRSLLVGLTDDQAEARLPLAGGSGELRYIGEVEYGFRGDERAELAAALAPLARPTTPFARGTRHEGLIHVQPVARVNVQFQCWSEGRLRHPVYRGLLRPLGAGRFS